MKHPAAVREEVEGKLISNVGETNFCLTRSTLPSEAQVNLSLWIDAVDCQHFKTMFSLQLMLWHLVHTLLFCRGAFPHLCRETYALSLWQNRLSKSNAHAADFRSPRVRQNDCLSTLTSSKC